ncbi:MAG: hypothetical protein ACKVRN_03610 [Pyrinomonadaceae bacterium]
MRQEKYRAVENGGIKTMRFIMPPSSTALVCAAFIPASSDAGYKYSAIFDGSHVTSC